MEQLLGILRDATILVLTFGYAGIFLAFLVEGSGIPLPFPGPWLLAFVGYAAWKGSLGVLEASIVAAAGTTLGAWLLYRLARNAGPLVVAKHGHRLALTPEKIKRAQSWFAVHAGRAVFFARLTPGVRIYIAVAAGLAHTQQAIFVMATLAGAWLWSLAFILLGWALGEGWQNVTDILSVVQSWMILIGVALLIFVAMARRRSGERDLKS
jgi:membrane protein DedA with SNARE-associated domain